MDFIRYTLKFPVRMMTEIDRLRRKEGVSKLDFILRLIRFSLAVAREIIKRPDTQIIIRKDGKDKEIVPLI